MDFERARTAMVDSQIRPNAVTDFDIIRIMSDVPRENFVPAGQRQLAYLDQHLTLSDQRKMISPMRLAQLIQLADFKKTDIVLDVACGTGYAAAIIAGLAGSVVAIDDQAGLVDEATEILADLEIGNVAVLNADLRTGCSKEAPFDVIFIEGAIESPTLELKEQLADGGRIVCVEPANGVLSAVVYTKSGSDIARREAFNATVPQLAAFSSVAEFSL
ncbi:protein-L-isoaspartate O-methyltransferase family protein [Maritalea porphyrae]|uniref:protein-L-isoaspartate O-methyltransferase family protein n=1 Tax=Maritalea porphyrae TaxID=880732 RepID=UPI0022AEAC9A|nr:protein-L-isoaspartate O-methyltransferase [Maritalea porphyrae]MCZ4273170.1 protein-L-isoaspartate O-methyltransferase [Maritalea porphyrae]